MECHHYSSPRLLPGQIIFKPLRRRFMWTGRRLPRDHQPVSRVELRQLSQEAEPGVPFSRFQVISQPLCSPFSILRRKQGQAGDSRPYHWVQASSGTLPISSGEPVGAVGRHRNWIDAPHVQDRLHIINSRSSGLRGQRQNSGKYSTDQNFRDSAGSNSRITCRFATRRFSCNSAETSVPWWRVKVPRAASKLWSRKGRASATPRTATTGPGFVLSDHLKDWFDRDHTSL